MATRRGCVGAMCAGLVTLAPALVGAREGSSALSLLSAPAPNDRILVIAPHIDDEAIASGGYIHDAVVAGAGVWIVYLTAGDANRTAAAILGRTLRPRAKEFLHEGEVRFEEGKHALGLLGVAKERVFLLGYPDGALADLLAHPGAVVRSERTGASAVPYAAAFRPGAAHTLGDLERDLAAVLKLTAPTLVIAPDSADQHADHAAGGGIVLQVLAAVAPASPRLLTYIVHARGFPDPFARSPRRDLAPPPGMEGRRWLAYPVGLTAEKAKREALRAYVTQRKDPYLRVLLEAFVRRNELFIETEDSGPTADRSPP